MGIYTYGATGKARSTDVIGRGVLVFDEDTGEFKLGDGENTLDELPAVNEGPWEDITDSAELAAAVSGIISNVVYDADTWDGDTLHAPSKNTLRDKFEDLYGSFIARAGGTSLVAAQQPMLNVRDYGAVGDGITDDTAAIQAAITAAGAAGRPSSVLLPSDGTHPAAYLITATLTFPTNGIRLLAPSRAVNGSGARIKWGGAVGGTMIQVSQHRISLENFCVDALGIAAVGIAWSPSKRGGELHNIQIYNTTDTALVVGNGAANVNEFYSQGLYIETAYGGKGIVVWAAATEWVIFQNTRIGSVLSCCVEIKSGPTDFYGLTIENTAGSGYAIQCTGGSIGIYDAGIETPQFFKKTNFLSTKPCIFERVAVRSLNPAPGEYAMDIGGNEAGPANILMGVDLQRGAGATNEPNIYVQHGVVINLGTTFRTADVGGTLGTFIKHATGTVMHLDPRTGDTPEAIIRGRPVGAGAGPVIDLTAAQVAAIAIAGGVGSVSIPADKTADYIGVASDKGSSIGMNSAGALNFTIAADVHAVGDMFEVRQVGAGQVTLVPSGVTLRSPDGALKTRKLYSAVSILCVANNVFSVQGDLIP